MGAFFQISHSSTELPVEDPDEIPQRQTQYYDQLFSANLEETPYEDIITSAQHGNLTVTISSGHGIEGTHISAWTFSSPNLNFSSPPMAITNSTRYRAELFAIMKRLYIIYKAESIVTPDSSTTINIQCSHKTALVEAFRDSPLGIKTATQLNYDLLMDIRSLRNMIRSTLKPSIGAPPLQTSTPTSSTPSHDDILRTFLARPTLTNTSLVINHTPLSHVVSIIHEGKTIGTDLKTVISNIAYTRPLKKKIQKDTGWADAQVQQIAWQSFFGAIRRVSRSHRISIIKLSNQLWNTNVQNQKYYDESPLCPICQLHPESFSHVFCCSHPTARDNRQESLTQLQSSLHRSTPPELLNTILEGIIQ